jgi:hypothetical protein
MSTLNDGPLVNAFQNMGFMRLPRATARALAMRSQNVLPFLFIGKFATLRL